ncbi:MAG: outer membrane beta-barrel protein [bacterium]
MKAAALFCLALLCVFLLPLKVQAERGLLLSGNEGWQFHPYLTFQQYYDDNPSRNPKGSEESDYLSVGRTGIRIVSPNEARKGRVRLKADLYGDWLIFAKRDIKGIRPALDLRFDYVPGTGLEVNVFDVFTMTNEAPTNEETGLALNVQNSGQFGLKYRFARVGVSVAYQNDLLEYTASDANDRMLHSIISTLFCEVSPSFKVSAEYTYGLVKYARLDLDHSDAVFHQGQMGIDWEATPKITVAARAGYQVRDYRVASRGDYAGWVGSLALDWNILARSTTLSLRAARDLVESVYQGNNYYASNGGTLVLGHRLGERWRVSINGSWYLDQYPDATTEGAQTQRRSDQTWIAGVDLDFFITQGLSVGSGYFHRERDSNFDGFDYRENRVKFIQIASVF